jgi:2-haloacid dehalogenase
LISSIIFDVDGTLYDETTPKSMAELIVAEYINKFSEIDVATIYSTFRKTKSRIVNSGSLSPNRNDRKIWYTELFNELNINNIDVDLVTNLYWNTIYANIKPFYDILYVLPYLKEHYRLFTLSDELDYIHRKKIEHLGIGDFFQANISSDNVGVTKPSSKLFSYALEIVGDDPDKVLIVGDNPSADIAGGNKAGMNTAWLKRGKYTYYNKKEMEKPSFSLTNYIQLTEKIKQLENMR